MLAEEVNLTVQRKLGIAVQWTLYNHSKLVIHIYIFFDVSYQTYFLYFNEIFKLEWRLVLIT